jgi:hyperosmotically inducible periplasmic protein
MNSRTFSILLVSTLALSLGACDGGTSGSAPTSQGTTPADNTARNRADQNSTAKTPLDQSNTASDTRITADIRKSVLNDSTLSTNAHNCKIITEQGVVTLRGPVNSQAEKDTVEAKAKVVAGVTSVVNEIEVKSN